MELADQLRALWVECKAHQPDEIIAGPVFYAVYDTVVRMPPKTDRRKQKRLIRKAVERAKRG